MFTPTMHDDNIHAPPPPLPLLANAQEYNNRFANAITLPNPNLLLTLQHVPTPPSLRAGQTISLFRIPSHLRCK